MPEKFIPRELVKETDTAVVSQMDTVRMLNVSPYKVQQASKRGQLEMVKVGGRPHYTMRSILRLVRVA